MKFQILIVKTGDVLNYRVVYQSEKNFNKIINIGSNFFTQINICSCDIPEISRNVLFLRGCISSSDHRVGVTSEQRLIENYIERINTYYAELQNISN
jgi:hypothetical protein